MTIPRNMSVGVMRDCLRKSVFPVPSWILQTWRARRICTAYADRVFVGFCVENAAQASVEPARLTIAIVAARLA
jgi:hypothetical protein